MKYVKGDLLDVDCGVIVHGCNSRGVMSGGVAKVLRAKYPAMFLKYYADLASDEVRLGGVSWHRVDDKLQIASAITQEDFGGDGKRYVSYDAVEEAFLDIFHFAQCANSTVSLPFVGAGLGGGDWDVIEAIILSAANKCKYSKELITFYSL